MENPNNFALYSNQLNKTQNTIVASKAQKLQSWISTFLKHGNNIWWTETDEAYLFNDGEKHHRPANRPATSKLLGGEIIDHKSYTFNTIVQLFNYDCSMKKVITLARYVPQLIWCHN